MASIPGPPTYFYYSYLSTEYNSSFFLQSLEAQTNTC